jgi:hypothetical protein
MSRSPGLYVAPSDEAPEHDLASRVTVTGHLASQAATDRLGCWFDGLLTDGRTVGRSDAEVALEAYRERGVDGLTALEGFYTLFLIDEAAEATYLLSDPLCSRPLYLYRGDSVTAAASTPLAFAEWELPMHLSRTGLYGIFRFVHSSGRETLVEEVERLQPGLLYRLGPDDAVTTERVHSLDYDVNPDITLDEATEWLKSSFGAVLDGTLSHPALRDRPIHLPLTAGLDSRHILGELIDQGRPPDQLRHVYMEESDYEPVRQIAEGLDLPLHCVSMQDLDVPALTRRWMERSGGLVNVHQSYLLHLAQHKAPEAVVGFNGYLMDWFLGIAPRNHPSPDNPVGPLWNRTYTRPNMLRALFKDEPALREPMRARLEALVGSVEGPAWYRLLMADFHQRGLHYTGVVDPMLADDALYVSPGAHRWSLEFVRTAPKDVAGERRARLGAMRRHFPELAAYPGPRGVPYADQTKIEKLKSSRWEKVLPILKAVATGFRTDPAPESEHEWIRRIDAFHDMHRRTVFDSALVRDGHLRAWGVKGAWYLLRAGSFQGWTLMSHLTAETAYRLLVKQQSLDDVTEWLWATSALDPSPARR